MTDPLDSLLLANQAFYDAFDRRDPAAMEALWSRDHAVTCIHPGWDRLTGHDEVMASWRNILANPQAPRVQCREPQPLVEGRFGTVICHEVLADGVLVATNLFIAETGGWRMVHHHASAIMARPSQRASRSIH
jgi:hypothetical protein